jgi:eukaryotic-like serine/threonine-protein kinase
LQRREQFLQGLLELHKLRDPGTRRAAWRGSIASVARACSEDLPSPLDGLSSAAVAESVRVALATGLIDDLDWLSASSAGAALYEIASVLPSGNEKRELGRRVLTRLIDGDADAFVALATRMALGSGKGLGGEAVRARVALAVALPATHGVRVDPMALSLISRRELAREWLTVPAVGSLPDRRMAGRLLEQAARAIVRRVAQGDERALSVLRSEAVSRSSDRLFEDREPLVWRHVAIARGLLAPYVPAYADAIERGLGADMSPTEWRRSATSLVAMAAVRPEEAARRLRDVLARGFLRRDPGAATALLWAVPAAAEVEPEAAEELLDVVVDASPPMLVAEFLPELIALGPGGSFGKRTAALLRDALGQLGPASALPGEIDDGAVALRARVLADLGPAEERQRSTLDALRDGLRAFAEQGAKVAFQAGLEALDITRGSLATLEALQEPADGGRQGTIARRASFAALREIDTGLLEDGTLRDLLVLGLRSPEAQRALEDVGNMHEHIAAWVIEREQAPLSRTGPLPHRTLRFHRLRMLLHLADVRADDERDEAQVAQQTRARCLRLANLMLRHLVTGPPQALHRMICAAFARAVDALLRDEGCDAADVLLWVAQRGLSHDDLGTLVEASMNTDLRVLLRAYIRMLRALDDDAGPSAGSPSVADSIAPPSMLSAASVRPQVMSSLGGTAAGRRVDALAVLAREMEVDSSTRIEALRGAVVRLARSLGRVLASRSLAEVAGAAGTDTSPVRELEASLAGFAQLCQGARQRMGDRVNDGLSSSPALALSSAVDAALNGNDSESLPFGVASAREELSIALPPVFVDVASTVIDGLLSVPLVASIRPAAPEVASPDVPLPAWLPRRRTLGGFYVVRALGAGTGGTVFMARRIEDRHDEASERFALKVPDYDGNAARTLSEEQFLQLFREEATALLGLPAHLNLARFVTFDLAARPKPILVMELVEGMSLERLVLSNSLDVGRVFQILDGVLAGLGAMHGAGVGHLDIKPSNVILRTGAQPVLVDFGLSGRRIRPGCATLPYGAPEIWGLVPEGIEPGPAAADMYAFACLAYEMLTGRELFDAPTEMAMVTAHLAHDGWPDRLQALHEQETFQPLCQILSHALRQDPRNRPPSDYMRVWLADVAAPLLGEAWPLCAPRLA